MSSSRAEEPRVRPLRGPWAWSWDAVPASWLSARSIAAAAGVAIVVLFGTLYFALREDDRLPRRRADFPSAPQLNSQISAAQERLKADPQDIGALTELGLLMFQRGKDSYVEAINALEEARELGALDSRIFYCLGIMYQEEGLFSFALTEYKRFLRHYPEDKEVRMLAAKLYYRMGLFTEAVGEFERLKFDHPKDPLVEENLGLSLWGAKQMERAASSFAQLKSHEGEHARRAEFYLGEIALEAGKHEEAGEHFAKVGLRPMDGIPEQRQHAAMGLAYAKLSRWEESKASWEAALKAAPGDAKAKAGLREAERRLAQAKRAAAKKK